MALKTLLLRNKLDTKKKTLETLRQKDVDFEKREKEYGDKKEVFWDERAGTGCIL